MHAASGYGFWAAGLLATAAVFAMCECGAAAAGAVLPLTKDGKPACKVIVAGAKPGLLMDRAADAITGTVRRWSGVDLAVTAVRDDNLPAGPAIVLATVDGLRKVIPEAEVASHELMRASMIDEQGYACVPVGERVVVVSRTARGVYNGALYLAEFCIDGPAEALSVHLEPTVRSPQMQGRASYTLNIWGHEARYTAKDWRTILDSFARDGLDRVYFWVSGHFPSKKFPQTYRCSDYGFDSTVNSGIGTVEDLRSIMDHCHDLGMMFYMGSGLGGWCGTGLITNKQADTLKKGPGITSKSLCPSHPLVRRSLIEYYKEMYDAMPEADGHYIEMADEWGECLCDVCSKPVDKLGSKQFGRSQITLIQEIAREIWRDHPHARFAMTFGYAEHKSDPAFYQAVKQMSDPRFEWMDARDGWEFPGPAGRPMPESYFSRQAMHWSQFYNLPLEHMVADANRAAKSGLYGLIMAFEPGAGTGSFYKDIPYPTGILPYVLTGFVFREVTWEPAISVDELVELTRRRFFGSGAPHELGRDLWTLRELIRTTSALGKLTDESSAALARIEERVTSAEPGADPKTRESLGLIRRAITDTREFCRQKEQK